MKTEKLVERLQKVACCVAAMCAVVCLAAVALSLTGCGGSWTYTERPEVSKECTVDGELYELFGAGEWVGASALRIAVVNKAYENTDEKSGTWVKLSLSSSLSDEVTTLNFDTGYDEGWENDEGVMEASNQVLWLFSDDETIVQCMSKCFDTASGKWSSNNTGYWSSAEGTLYLAAGEDGNAQGCLTVTATLYYGEQVHGAYDLFVSDYEAAYSKYLSGGRYLTESDAEADWPL